MNAIILGVALGLAGILACYTLAFGIGAIIARADRREQIDQRLSEFAHGDWPATSQMNVTEHSAERLIP